MKTQKITKSLGPTHGAVAQAHLMTHLEVALAHLKIVLAQRVDILAQKLVNLHPRRNI